MFINRKWLRQIIQTVLFMIFLSLNLMGCGSGNGSNDEEVDTARSEASLSGLTLTGITLDQTFQAELLTYSAGVNFSQDSTNLTAIATDASATIQINGIATVSGQISETITLAVGHNLIEVLVTADDGHTTKTYTIDILRASGSSEASLSDLALSGVELDQSFQAERTIYTASVDASQETITLTPIAAATGATIRINDIELKQNDGPLNIDLTMGENLISLEVTAEDGVSTETYTLAILRGSGTTTIDPQVLLSGLSIAGAELDRVFQPDRTIYTAHAIFSQDAITLTPIVGILIDDGIVPPFYSTNATILVNGQEVASGQPSEPITLALGQNTIAIQVNSEDGNASITYTLVVYRITSPSAEAHLSDLSLSSASLDPLFQPDQTTYSTNVGAYRTCAILTTVPAHAGANIEIKGTEVAAGNTTTVIDLAEGENRIDLRVTAEDGIATNDYTLSVFRQYASLFPQQTALVAATTGRGDWFGESVAISGDTLVVGAHGEVGTGAAYAFTRLDDGWTQQAYLKASNADAGDRFGSSVAISNDTLVVGAPYESSSADGGESDNSSNRAGAAYVFIRKNGVWSQQAYLKASNASDSDYFGDHVAISGDTLVVATSREDNLMRGAVYVYVRSGENWSQQAYLKASNGDRNDWFGASVAISGDTLVVGATGEDGGANGIEDDNSAVDAGAAYVFTRSNGLWSQQAYLKASNAEAGDRFGNHVAISNDTLVVGAYSEDSGASDDEDDNTIIDSGAAYVFTRGGGIWTQQAYLKASNPGEADLFGAGLAIFNDTLVIGAYGEASGTCGGEGDNSASFSGAAYLFTYTGGVWSQQAYLKANDSDRGSHFGRSVAISNDALVVGAGATHGASGEVFIWE